MYTIYWRLIVFGMIMLCSWSVTAQIGKRFPSERKIVRDPVTGIDLVFLTSTSAGDSKIYQTHNQWTSDGKWLVFRSDRVPGEAIAVHEESGEMVQVVRWRLSKWIWKDCLQTARVEICSRHQSTNEYVESHLLKLVPVAIWHWTVIAKNGCFSVLVRTKQPDTCLRIQKLKKPLVPATWERVHQVSQR